MACTLDSKRLPRWGRQWWGLEEQPNEEQAHSLDPKEPELNPGPGPGAHGTPGGLSMPSVQWRERKGSTWGPAEHRLDR